MIRRGLVVALALCSSIPAFADEATARKDFEAGERAYNLGDFQKAIELFKKAYEEWPEPAFLFNMAQTYRQAGDCKQALFFYKRFLALKANDTKKPIKPELKKEVENRIVELEECTKREIANKPPDQLDNGTGTSTSGTGTGTGTSTGQGKTTPGNTTTTKTDGTGTAKDTANANENTDENNEEDEGQEPTTPVVGGRPKTITARVLGGAGKLGAGNLEIPVQFFGTLVGGYPLPVGDKLQLEPGAAVSFTPVPYTTSTNQHGSGAVIALLANFGVAYTVAPKVALRGEVGAGALLFSGLEKMGNPFTDGGAEASGALTTFAARVGASVDYAVTPNVLITATPIAFTYAPAPSGFASSISSLTTLSFLVGVGYQR